MKAFKRISVAINAQINGIIDQIEDQEAAADAAIAEIRESLIQTKYHAKRIQNEQGALEKTLGELVRDEAQWKQRALRARDQEQNHERALECVRRLAQTQKEIQSINAQLIDYRKLEDQLTKDLREIEGKLGELRQRRNSLSARDSRAQTLKKVSEHQNCRVDASVFERWEQRVLRSEVESEMCAEESDSFADAFVHEEERQELESLLTQLEDEK